MRGRKIAHRPQKAANYRRQNERELFPRHQSSISGVEMGMWGRMEKGA